MFKKYQHNKRAYSLLEIGIVILIISILVTGALSVYFSFDDGIKDDVNKEKFRVIYNAIGKFVLENGRLPCPAPINVARTISSNFGLSGGSAGACQDSGVYLNGGNLVYGMIPIQDLDLGADYAIDAYGNKFTYVIDQRFSNNADSNGFGSIYPIPSIMTIRDKVGSQNHDFLTDAIFVIISHGRNNFGSFTQNSTLIGEASSDSDEQENYATIDTINSATFDNVFINKSYNNEAFDDQLFFKSRDQIIIDFRAYHKVYCLSDDADEDIDYEGVVSFTWPTVLYDNFVESDIDCPDRSGDDPPGNNWQFRTKKPIKRCGILGKWDDTVTVPCVYN